MFSFTVRPESGDPFVLKVGTRDVLTWEKTTKGKSYTDLLNEPNLTDYYKLCHLAAWRQQIFTGNLQAFEEQHDIDLYAGAREMLTQIDGILSQVMAPADAIEAIRQVMADDEDVADPEPDPTQSAASADDSSSSPSEPASPRRSGRKKANARS